ncbi:type II toxin-antitoxin system PemK/MazF family toxin [Sulfurimonas sp.]|uniref:type II toxin-antitoxin system PemK/MazF family toxin n=1 Tax=Sulfurimonas sp. TaxID=2022749 RepID=UPI0025DB21FD|nr:type II toxin-antitoxin system PemK/MazF family toxin [Sulfurimonas sp.]
MEIKQADIVLCTFYFSDMKKSKERPVLVFKDNLPHNDFIAIPISSKIQKLHQDEMIIDHIDFLDGDIPVKSKLMIRKTFVVSKDVVLKKYGSLSIDAYKNYHQKLCNYFGCN